MKSTRLKAILLGLSCLAFVSTFAQDTSKMPKKDTTKWPKHDSTSMSKSSMHSNSVSYNVGMLNSSLTKNEDLIAIKKEAENVVLTKKSFAKISS
jgi:hypothetical protein